MQNASWDKKLSRIYLQISWICLSESGRVPGVGRASPWGALVNKRGLSWGSRSIEMQGLGVGRRHRGVRGPVLLLC